MANDAATAAETAAAKKDYSLERSTLFGMVLVNLGIAGKKEVFPSGVPSIIYEKESIFDSPKDTNGIPSHVLEGVSLETQKTVGQMMQAQNAIVERASYLVNRQETGNAMEMV